MGLKKVVKEERGGGKMWPVASAKFLAGKKKRGKKKKEAQYLLL